MFGCSHTGDDENAAADDRTDAERGQTPGAETADQAQPFCIGVRRMRMLGR